MNRLKRKGNEDGFTLIELIVVIVVLSILAIIAMPIIQGQQRNAQIAALKSDVRNSINNIVNPYSPLTFNSPAEYVQLSPVSDDDNILGLTIYSNKQSPVACAWGVRDFGNNDKVSYHYYSDTGLFAEGTCNPADTVEEVLQTPVAATPAPVEVRPSVPFEINGPYTQGTVTYTPEYQYNSYGTGSVTIRIKITSTSDTTEGWSYNADMVKAPYFNSLSSAIQYNDGQGKISFPSSTSLRVDAINQWNGVSKNRPVTITFNLTSFIPPDVPEYYTVKVEKQETPWSMWHACISVKVTGTSEVPVTWSETINLNDYFASLGNRKVDFINLDKTSRGDNVYTVSGNSTNSDFVSPNHPIDNSQTICYNPEGNKAFK